MRARGGWRAIGLAAVLLGATFAARAALPPPEGTEHGDALTGQLLVAAPELVDPHFAHAVVLLVRHNDSGALGIVLNRPLGSQNWADLLESVGESIEGVAGDVPLFDGGPVQHSAGFVVHSADYRISGTIDVDGRVAVTVNPAILRAIATKQGPLRWLIALGYAGWGPGQLEHELALHGWIVVPSDPQLIFDEDRSKLWDTARAREAVPL